MNELIYYIREYTEVNEGGISRDSSFFKKIKNVKKKKIIVLKTSCSSLFRIVQSIVEIMRLLFYKNKFIFMHQSTLNIIFISSIFSRGIFQKILSLILMRIASINKLVIEINDLPYEQSLDLDNLAKDKIEIVKKIQDVILSIQEPTFIFASEEMRKYAVKKYKMIEEKTHICLNGSIEVEKKHKNEILAKIEEVKCVYAGTLNKGRDIEKLIDLFENKIKHCKLILLGISGEWILEKNYKNIIYLGSFSEKEALNIVSNCDIGLVPYTEKKLYYNLCYPTKNSFYINAGIPIMVPPLKETIHQLEKYDILFIEKIQNWELFFNSLDINKIKTKKINVDKIKNHFTWDYLIDALFSELKI